MSTFLKLTQRRLYRQYVNNPPSSNNYAIAYWRGRCLEGVATGTPPYPSNSLAYAPWAAGRDLTLKETKS